MPAVAILAQAYLITSCHSSRTASSLYLYVRYGSSAGAAVTGVVSGSARQKSVT